MKNSALSTCIHRSGKHHRGRDEHLRILCLISIVDWTFCTRISSGNKPTKRLFVEDSRLKSNVCFDDSFSRIGLTLHLTMNFPTWDRNLGHRKAPVELDISPNSARIGKEATKSMDPKVPPRFSTFFPKKSGLKACVQRWQWSCIR